MLSLRISSTEISRPFGNVGLTTRISAPPAVRRCTLFPGLLRQEGKRGSVVVGEILDICVAEQGLGKGSGALARRHAARCIADQGCPGLVVTPRHSVLHSPHRPIAGAIISLILECISSSATAMTTIERIREILGLKASTVSQ